MTGEREEGERERRHFFSTVGPPFFPPNSETPIESFVFG